MKRLALPFLADVALMLGLASAGHAVEIFHWQRLPLAIPLIVGEERVIFIDRNVRVGVPPSLGDHLRVQSAGGAIYLRANAPIEPTRLQLQDAGTGALILLDIAARPAAPNQAPLEPVRIVEADAGSKHSGRRDSATLESDSAKPPASRAPQTPIPAVLTRYA